MIESKAHPGGIAPCSVSPLFLNLTHDIEPKDQLQLFVKYAGSDPGKKPPLLEKMRGFLGKGRIIHNGG